LANSLLDLSVPAADISGICLFRSCHYVTGPWFHRADSIAR
jgi:hypothetical protein